LKRTTDVVTRHDLADRSLFISLDPIPDHKRLPEKELNKQLNIALPVILGGLLDAVSVAILFVMFVTFVIILWFQRVTNDKHDKYDKLITQ